MILHLIKTSPFKSRDLEQCLQQLRDTDGILLIQDGVLAVTGNQVWHDRLKIVKHFYVLEEDLLARGIDHSGVPFRSIDYQQFVALTLKFDKVQTWT